MSENEFFLVKVVVVYLIKQMSCFQNDTVFMRNVVKCSIKILLNSLYYKQILQDDHNLHIN